MMKARDLRHAGIGILAAVSASGVMLPIQAATQATGAGEGKNLYSPETDTLFSEPYVDIDEMRAAPFRHRYVHGGFKGTDLKFSFYFPEKKQYQGRFFHYVTPVPDSETSAQAAQGGDSFIGAALEEGAYFVETNGGGSSATAGPGMKADASIGAFRANAAAARYSRVIAQKMYGGKRPFGYIFGGSGGAYRTIGSVENTRGVWDGAVPFVVGSPMAIPNVFAVRMHAMRVLRSKFPQIVDALEPGGSGDPYAGLNEEEAGALREATRLGFPLQGWFAYETMGVHAFTAVYPGIQAADPSYFEDFWTKPGYLGFNAPESLKKARLQYKTTLKALLSEDEAVARGLPDVRIPGTARGSADLAWRAQVNDGSRRPVAIQLAGAPPEVGFLGGDLLVLTGAAKGKRLPLRAIQGDLVTFGVTDLASLAALKPGDAVQVDNSNFLAAQTYYRHQVPDVAQYPVWKQFLGADGKPLYPQRPMLLGPLFSRAAAGTIPNGEFQGKMILLESMLDREAFPWQGDWYRQRVKEHLGARTEDNFRIWMIDRATHGGIEDPTRVVSYLGVLQQALRDVANWVEKGTAPAASTAYRVEDGQVILPATAAARKGVQPVVNLTANRDVRAEVKPGQPVTFTGTITLPPGTGSIVAAEWNFEGAEYVAASPIKPGARTATVTVTHSFSKPGTYFPALRAISHRNGNAGTPYARIPNLGRVRVTVR